MTRIIGGRFRGRKLEQPPLAITRPTKDRVKEAIFNIIQMEITGAIVLDLFAGSGSLGLEAISRGAMKVIAVESNPQALAVQRQNMDMLQVTNCTLVANDVLEFLHHTQGMQFDFIFLDPPFAQYQIYQQVLFLVNKQQLLKPQGRIILETDNPQKIVIPSGLLIQREKKYGKSHMLILTNNI